MARKSYKERDREAERRSKRRVVINWIIMLVSGLLIIICYYFH